jgi:hypothetical protein
MNKPFEGPYRHVAVVLVDIFTNAVARWGEHYDGLNLGNPNKQWQACMDEGDTVAFISWCADKMEYWRTPDFKKYWPQAPLYGEPKRQDFKIMSPDGKTDWTLVAWYVYKDTNSKLPFTKDILVQIEAALEDSKYFFHANYAYVGLWEDVK